MSPGMTDLSHPAHGAASIVASHSTILYNLTCTFSFTRQVRQYYPFRLGKCSLIFDHFLLSSAVLLPFYQPFFLILPLHKFYYHNYVVLPRVLLHHVCRLSTRSYQQGGSVSFQTFLSNSSALVISLFFSAQPFPGPAGR